MRRLRLETYWSSVSMSSFITYLRCLYRLRRIWKSFLYLGRNGRLSGKKEGGINLRSLIKMKAYTKIPSLFEFLSGRNNSSSITLEETEFFAAAKTSSA